MCSCTEARSISRPIAWRTALSLRSGCFVLALERSPSTSVHGSVLFSWMCSMLAVLEVIFGVDFAAQHVARLEVDELVRASADRLQVGRRVAGFCAAMVRKQMLRDQHAARADEGIRPERRRLVEQHFDREVVEFFAFEILVGAMRHARR